MSRCKAGPHLAGIHRQLASNVLQCRLQAAEACTHECTSKDSSGRKETGRERGVAFNLPLPHGPRQGRASSLTFASVCSQVPISSPSATASGPVDRYTSPNRCSLYQNITAFQRPRLWQRRTDCRDVVRQGTSACSLAHHWRGGELLPISPPGYTAAIFSPASVCRSLRAVLAPTGKHVGTLSNRPVLPRPHRVISTSTVLTSLLSGGAPRSKCHTSLGSDRGTMQS